MIYVTYSHLREQVAMDQLNENLLMEIFDKLSDGDKLHFLFTNTNEYKDTCPQYAVNRGWNPDTTLVLYELPPTEEERAAQAAATAKAIEEDPNWDDIQVGPSEPNQIICSFFQDLTLEKLVQTLNSYAKLKAFL